MFTSQIPKLRYLFFSHKNKKVSRVNLNNKGVFNFKVIFKILNPSLWSNFYSLRSLYSHISSSKVLETTSKLILLVRCATFYINGNFSTGNQEGSFKNPFISLSQAYETIGPVTAELIIQGSSLELNSFIGLGPGTNYTLRLERIFLSLMYLRPEDSFSEKYFPIHLQMNAQIKLTNATLNLTGFDFIEHYFERTNAFLVLNISQSSTLIFNVNKNQNKTNAY